MLRSLTFVSTQFRSEQSRGFESSSTRESAFYSVPSGPVWVVLFLLSGKQRVAGGGNQGSQGQSRRDHVPTSHAQAAWGGLASTSTPHSLWCARCYCTTESTLEEFILLQAAIPPPPALERSPAGQPSAGDCCIGGAKALAASCCPPPPHLEAAQRPRH